MASSRNTHSFDEMAIKSWFFALRLFNCFEMENVDQFEMNVERVDCKLEMIKFEVECIILMLSWCHNDAIYR